MFFFFNYAYAQYECGTEPPKSYTFFDNNKIQDEIDILQNTFRSSPRVYIVSLNVIRDNQGENGPKKYEIENAFSRLNSAYAPINIEFQICGNINYIDNSSLLTLEKKDRTKITSKYNINGVLNIYLFPEIVSNKKRICGFALLPGGDINTKAVFISDGCLNNNSTLIHEMGHFFGLLHTHETYHGIEQVARINCDKLGDGFCDTPADPKLSSSNTSNCRYTGNEHDASGNKYKPDVNNFMSYAPKNCRIHFSNEQMAYISLIAKQENDYINSNCDLPDLSIKAPGSKVISIESFKDFDIEFDILKYNFNDFNDTFTIKIGLSSLYNSFGKTIYTNKILPNKKNRNSFKITIPFDQNILNAKYFLVIIDANEEIEEQNELNNSLRLNISLDKLHKDIDFIFPNPIKNKLSFYTYDSFTGQIDFCIYDINGKFVNEYSFIKYDKNAIFNIENLELKNGMYILSVKKEGESPKNYKFVK